MILADTQAVVWLTLDRSKLSRPAIAAFVEAHTASAGVAIASTTLWELALLSTRGRIEPRGSLSDYLKDVETRFTVLSINAAIAERAMRFTSKFPKDPADRLIAATALVYQIPLVTSDVPIRKSGEVLCIW